MSLKSLTILVLSFYLLDTLNNISLPLLCGSKFANLKKLGYFISLLLLLYLKLSMILHFIGWSLTIFFSGIGGSIITSPFRVLLEGINHLSSIKFMLLQWVFKGKIKLIISKETKFNFIWDPWVNGKSMVDIFGYEIINIFLDSYDNIIVKHLVFGS